MIGLRQAQTDIVFIINSNKDINLPELVEERRLTSVFTINDNGGVCHTELVEGLRLTIVFTINNNGDVCHTELVEVLSKVSNVLPNGLQME